VSYDGSTVELDETGVFGASRSVWGSSEDDMYIVGENGLILEMCP